jgi:hypothetical protein
MPLINYNANRIEALGSQGQFGIQRGTLPNITASVTSSCINYEDTGFISMSGITGGRGPEYNYSLFDVSASAFITQSTTISSALISNLSNSTYSLNISNDGIFAYTQSIVITCPPPPNLEVEYLVVGGGAAGQGAGDPGGSAGGVRSGSLSIPYRTTLSNIVGLGGITGSRNGFSSSISSSTLGFFGAGGATGNSGQPTEFSQGVTGPGIPIPQGGGAGSSQNGQDGVLGVSGNGGSGSVWVNGLFYAGGGGGNGGGVPGLPGLGGGGTAQTGFGPDGLPYQLNGYNGTGGGAASSGTSGGSGVVIFRYSTGSVRPAFGGTTEISGGYVYHTFTGSGEFRYAKS